MGGAHDGGFIRSRPSSSSSSMRGGGSGWGTHGLTHSLTTGKVLPGAEAAAAGRKGAAAAAAAAGGAGEKAPWVVAGKSIGQVKHAEGISSSHISRPATAGGSYHSGRGGGGVTAGGKGIGFGEVIRPGSACAVLGGIAGHKLLAEREEQVSGALLVKLKQKADAAVQQELREEVRNGAGGDVGALLDTHGSGSSTKAVKAAAADEVAVQEYVHSLEADVKR